MTDLIDRALATARRAIELRADASLRAGIDHMRAHGATDVKIAEMLVILAENSSDATVSLYAEMRGKLERRGATVN